MFCSIIFIIVFYGLCIYAMQSDESDHKQKLFKIGTVQSAVAISFLVVITMIVFYWVKQNRYIYFWDYSGYWTMSIERAKYMFEHSLIDNFKTLYESINNDDYNVFLPTILAFPMKTMGNEFSTYVLLCFAMFLIPTFFVQGRLAVKMIKTSKISDNWIFVIFLIASSCFVQNYYALLRGYVDVAYLLPMSVAMYLFVEYDFERVSFRRNSAIVCMLILTWICRRYTIFFLIGYAVAMLVKGIYTLLKNHSSARSVVVNFIEIGTFSIAVLMLFFRRFFLHALLTNYGEMYSAYDAPLSQKVQRLIENFGYDTAIIVVLVGIILLFLRIKDVNYIALVLMAVIEICMFWNTQDMGVQHYMILNVPIFMLVIMSFNGCIQWWSSQRGAKKRMAICVQHALATLCIIVIFINFAKVFFHDISSAGCGTLFPQRYYPLQRNDISTIETLTQRLNELTEKTDNYVYVAASGMILNNDILRKADMPDTANAVPHMYATCDVDLRDGFPTDFLYAKYIVTTDPVQLHLPSGQEVVNYLALNVQNPESYIGRHFQYMEQYELDDGVIAKIYVKISDFNNEDLQEMRDHYGKLYPGYSNIFEDKIKLG